MNNQATAEPERPIRTKSEDLLDRGRFVTRLCDALINRQTGLATGVTLGITGEWGSGKSSILNLLHEHIAKQYPNAIIVRFDPWLVSGRDDLIRQFFLDFQSSIKEKPALRDKLSTLVDRIAEYSTHIAPLVNLKLPGVGDAVSGGVNAVNRVINREVTLHTQRQEIMRALRDARAPLVVLIDELDRVEDAEIRAVAQLVRAVADFPSISYVLAYDHDRVTQALGAAGEATGRIERGRAYLEKIVQFQIALPVTLDDELKALLQAELTKLVTDVALPDGWQKTKRFQDLVDIMIPHPITTPRDIKRLVGTYHVIGSMLKGEVEWVDLLAFSVLLVKAPATVEKLRHQPDSVVANPLSHRASLERYSDSDSGPDDRLAKFVSQEEASAGVADLLPFLFPRFSKDPSARDRDPDALCFRRPLLTALRMGLLPGASSRNDVENFLSLNAGEIERSLWNLYDGGDLPAFFERLETVYVAAAHVNHRAVWLGVSRFLRRHDGLWPNAYSPMRDVTQAFGELFARACVVLPELRAKAGAILEELLCDGDVELVTYMLTDQAFHHGLFGLEKRNSGISLLTPDKAEEFSRNLANSLRDRHLTSNWIVSLRDPQPIILIVRVGIWDQACKDKLESVLQDDKAFDTFVLMLFGGRYVVGRDFVGRLMSLDMFLHRVNARVASESLKSVHPTVQDALRKALKRS